MHIELTKKDVKRFMAKVDLSDPSNCWEWLGGKSHGYGRFNIRGTVYNAHQIAFQIFRGDMPEGLEPDHTCRNKLCANPNHLDPVTHRENAIRADAGFNNRQKTHCPQGHPYNGENLLEGIRHDGRRYRHCRICAKTRQQQFFARKLQESA